MTDPNIKALRGPILVLGGGGFVGANLFLRLYGERQDVYAVVRKTPCWRLEGVVPDRIFEVDLTDRAAAASLISTIRPQTIFDCTAYGGYSFEENYLLIHKTNFLAAVDLLEHLAQEPFAAYIHAGSSSEYGFNCAAPKEHDECLPNSHYAVSKVAAASYLGYLGMTRGLPVVNLRLYSVYGPLEDTSRLMPQLVRQALDGKFPPLVNPDTSRDFIDISDVVDAFILAAVRMHPEMYGKSYNIGTGVRTTIGQLASQVREQFHLKDEPVFNSMPPRKWDLGDWYSDPALAREDFGWEAKVPLARGLEKMAQWVGGISERTFEKSTKLAQPARKRSVSAVIACYRDGQAIPHMYRRLTEVFTRIGCDYEIIFVNDCSPDDSAEVIRELSVKDEHVLGISHSRNFGSQMAFRSGMELATMDAVVLLDGDLQDPPELIEEFYAKWEEGNDVIYGVRVKREMPVLVELCYKLFYWIFASMSYIKIPRDAGDFSLIDRKVVGWMLTCPERDLFLRGIRAYMGFRQIGVPYVRPERMFGRSTNNIIKNIGWAKKALFSYSNAPLHALTTLGFGLLILSVFLGALAVFMRFYSPETAPRGFTSMLLGILFFGALNIFGLGILGEYQGKILEEVKCRPRLIRAAIIRNGNVSELLPDGSMRR